MTNGSIYYSPVYYNAQASDNIILPENICVTSSGLFIRWEQCGSTESSYGQVNVYHVNATVAISLSLQKRNGLYYTDITTLTLDKPDIHSRPSTAATIYFHMPADVPDDDASSTPTHLKPTHLPYPDQYPRIPRQQPFATMSLIRPTNSYLRPAKFRPTSGKLSWSITVNGNLR